MRRVELGEAARGGVLGWGSVLTTTSTPIRTSPVIRGKWVLETLFGEELPLPPPDAGELSEEGEQVSAQTVRQRLKLHRANPECAACHERIDPLGFGLENYDAIGRWWDEENGQPIDAGGVLPSGQQFDGVGRRWRHLRPSPINSLSRLVSVVCEFYPDRWTQFAVGLSGCVRFRLRRPLGAGGGQGLVCVSILSARGGFVWDGGTVLGYDWGVWFSGDDFRKLFRFNEIDTLFSQDGGGKIGWFGKASVASYAPTVTHFISAC